MFVFKRLRVRRKDERKHVAIAKSDWITLKGLSNKLKTPMSQLVHDTITIYAGFIYGVDHVNSVKIQRDLDLIGSELKKCRKILRVYIERFGEIDDSET